MSSNESCPCGSLQSYQTCCEPLHQGQQQAQTAEQLMRSRFTAFCKGQVEYLIESLHPSKRQADDRQVLSKNIAHNQWLSLKILGQKNGTSQDVQGSVEFVAFYQNQEPGQLHELSQFIKEEGQWFYLEGDMLEPIKFQRNEACWCGSGKKLKKCHKNAF